MQGKCARRINARLNRADLITDDAAGRYVGDGVDDGTHRNSSPGFSRTEQNGMKLKRSLSSDLQNLPAAAIPQGNYTVIGWRNCDSLARNSNITVLLGHRQRAL